MAVPPPITLETSGAFVESFAIEPTAAGAINGLTFAVKDLIDLAGHKTGCGNPTWQATHPPARSHAVCVEQLLAAGARCVGKTVTDELAFSLIGENHFYGTPLNPKAPDRVPGGSSSGSASAVACGLADFALGTDTGGSVRVPAGNCGIWGLRPSHGFVSVAGVMPFAPGFDTVGVLARSAETLARAISVLLGADQTAANVSVGGESLLRPATTTTDPSAKGFASYKRIGIVQPNTIHLVSEAFELADERCQAALAGPIDALRRKFNVPIQETSLAEICRDASVADLNMWRDTFYTVQWAEIESSLGAWIAASNPQFGPATAANFSLVKNLDRRLVAHAIVHREAIYRKLRDFLGPRDLLCIPTAPTPAPLKDSGAHDRTGDYYRRALALTSIAGLGRLPQVSMPLAEVDGAPLGLSLLAAFGEDLFLLAAANAVAK